MTASPVLPTAPRPPCFGLIVIGDEILSGKRQDKHLAQVIELLGSRGLRLSWAHYVGDDRAAITDVLRQAFARSDVVFSTGGIGATPDDHTRQAAAAALGVPLALHPQAKDLIEQRMREVAAEQGVPYDPQRPDNVQRLQMGYFPQGARIIPNPYNRIPGFSCDGPGGGTIHFVPGFPVMAWPMIGWVLDTHYRALFGQGRSAERSVIVLGGIEAVLTPLMERIEAEHPGVRVFSLPSVDHPEYGRHIELGVKGAAEAVAVAYPALLAGLRALGVSLGPELVRP
ncbi:competence/damage-inducible protein A [Tepidimonas sp.]|uniref:competence/damage-inducible protein A n=1 Tax=Tepidimonas sp. TaxID=2002775 RepID=UPI002FE16BC6